MSPLQPEARYRWVLICGACAWLMVAAAGLWTLWRYENQPGVAAVAPGQWPAGATIAWSSDRPTLLLLAHPQCTCTRATLTELAEVLARARNRPRTYVLFLKPHGVPDGWEASQLWRTAASLPDVTVMRDDDGTEARRFGAETSGQVVFYDTAGALRFSGGITSARGHAGDNEGRAALVALLNQTETGADRTNVFGCSLFSEGSRSS